MELLGKLRERIHEFPTIEESGGRFQVAASSHECLDFSQDRFEPLPFVFDDCTPEVVFHSRLPGSIFWLYAPRRGRFADGCAHNIKKGLSREAEPPPFSI